MIQIVALRMDRAPCWHPYPSYVLKCGSCRCILIQQHTHMLPGDRMALGQTKYRAIMHLHRPRWLGYSAEAHIRSGVIDDMSLSKEYSQVSIILKITNLNTTCLVY